MGLVADGMPSTGVSRGETQHSSITGLAQLYLPQSRAHKLEQENGQPPMDALEDEQAIGEEDAVMQEWQRIRMARVQCGC